VVGRPEDGNSLATRFDDEVGELFVLLHAPGERPVKGDPRHGQVFARLVGTFH
jgi:hypothetical protein